MQEHHRCNLAPVSKFVLSVIPDHMDWKTEKSWNFTVTI